MTTYRCNCGWTGDRPSLSDDSAYRPGPDGSTVWESRQIAVCPKCFANVHQAKETHMDDDTIITSTTNATNEVFARVIEEQARCEIERAIESLRSHATQIAHDLAMPWARDTFINAALSTTDGHNHRRSLIKQVAQDLAERVAMQALAAIKPKDEPTTTRRRA